MTSQNTIIEREITSTFQISGRKSIPLKEQEQMSLHHIKSSLWIFILAAIFRCCEPPARIFRRLSTPRDNTSLI